MKDSHKHALLNFFRYYINNTVAETTLATNVLNESEWGCSGFVESLTWEFCSGTETQNETADPVDDWMNGLTTFWSKSEEKE